MHRGGVPTPLSLRFLGPTEGPFCHIVLASFLKPILVPFWCPNWSQNGTKTDSTFEPKSRCLWWLDFAPLASNVSCKRRCQICPKRCFSNGFSTIFVYTHAAVTFHCVMLVLLELDPFWPSNVIKNEFQIGVSNRFTISSFWGLILARFRHPFGGLVGTLN